MQTFEKSSVLGLIAALALIPSVRANDLVISEVMAINDTTLFDETGATPDWIEIFNAGATVVNLDGWHLSDDPDELAKWTFPPLELAPGEFLIVFASGDDQRDPEKALHTNFELDGEGEFLGLSTPDRTLVSFFVPEYPVQVADSSYGREMQTISTTVLDEGATGRYFVPTDRSIDDVWYTSDFDDAAWASGPTAIGYDTKEVPTFADLIKTDVSEAMFDISESLYVRIPFTVAALDTGLYFRLRLKYDDAIVAWVNGQEVARFNFRAGVTPRYSSRALEDRGEFDLSIFEDAFLPPGVLQVGENVLALQVMNRSDTDEELLVLPVIEAVAITGVNANTNAFYEFASPGFPNLDGLPEASPLPEFSKSSGAFVPGDTLELTAPDGAQIRFTLDGTEPTRASELYSAPIPIDGAVMVKARTFKPGAIPGRVRTEGYIVIDPGLADFSSNLPIVVCATFGRPIGANCGGGLYTDGYVMIFEPGEDGRARLTEPAVVADTAGFRKRGSSTCGRPKFSFNVEIRDQQGEDKDLQVFDFPVDSDYVMYGAYNFDRVHMRNPIAYWMSREVGPWAARTRFVECFFHQSNGPLPNNFRTGSYMGLYSFMEKNKRHPEKVDVERLGRSDLESPEVEGGYILKRDRIGQGEVATSAGGYSSLVFVYPKQPEAAQRQWITNYINRAIASLSPNIGSQADSDLIDVQEFIDHHILCWYPKNVDAFRLSGYFHKRRDGLLAMGPVWDYDRTMGCADDSRADNPLGWDNTQSGDGGTRYFQAGGLGSWYSHLFNNVPPTGSDPWAKAYRNRWRELRAGPLATDNILAQIDAWAVEIAEAFDRNRQRWPAVGPRFGGLEGEVNHLKNWLATRADWIDSQFIEPPAFNPPGGFVEPGLQVSIEAPEGTIYYTINGPDPLGARRDPAPEALEYTAALTISANTRLRARARVGVGVWSELVEATYVTDPPDLVITEIMYNPPDLPDDLFSVSQYEFIELQNVGTSAVNLAGYSIVQRDDRTVFDFNQSLVRTVPSGGFVVVARNTDALAERYAAVPNVAGSMIGTLSNSGQRLAVLGPLGELAVDFVYDDDWYPETDGEGPSLVVVDPNAPRSNWAEAAGWRPSAVSGGTPGRAEGPMDGGLQLPGDVSQDAELNLLDGLVFFNKLFGLSDSALPCGDGSFDDPANMTLLDTNADGSLDLTDGVFLLNYLFLEGPAHVLGTTCMPIAGCPTVCAAN